MKARIPDNVRVYLKDMIKKTGVKNDEAAYQEALRAWLAKLRAFEQIVSARGLKEAAVFDENDPNGAVALSFSGSLLTIGPLGKQGRKISYASIGGRSGIPDVRVKENARLDGNLGGYAPAKFIQGPVRQTSPLYKIAVVPHQGPDGRPDDKKTSPSRNAPDLESELLTEVAHLLSLDSGGGNPTIVDE